MKIQKAQKRQQEPTVALKDIKPGDVIRFASDTFEDALKTDSFFMRLNAPETKPDRVRLVNITDGFQIERDDFHRVVIHKATLHLEP